MSAALVVRFAVALLPRRSRDRYREQWAADLRDAAEVGVPRGQIAAGALVLALTVDRPARAMRWPDAPGRARVALTAATASATIALSTWGGSVAVGPVTSNVVADYAQFVIAAFVGIIYVVSPVVSLGFAASRGVTRRRRIEVGMLLLASTAPVVSTVVLPLVAVDDPAPWQYWVNTTDLVYPIAGALVLAAALSTRPLLRLGSTTRSVFGIVTGTFVGAVASGLLASTAVSWISRTPLAFGEPVTAADRRWFEQLVLLAAAFESRVLATGIVLGVAALSLSVIVAIVVRRASARQAGLMIAGATAVVLIAWGQFAGFLWLGTASAEPLVEPAPVTAAAQLVLVLCILIGVSGMRLERTRGAERSKAA